MWGFSQENALDSTNTNKEAKFDIVEQPAEFPGGIPKFYQYLSSNIKYPKSARKKKLSGRVYIEFVINRDGSIDDESVQTVTAETIKLMSIRTDNILTDKECEYEAVRLIKASPNWLPGRQKGKPVRQMMVLPIIYKL